MAEQSLDPQVQGGRGEARRAGNKADGSDRPMELEVGIGEGKTTSRDIPIVNNESRDFLYNGDRNISRVW